MRNIPIETDTFAAIWADRQPGEETEDAIIRRKFGVKKPTPSMPTGPYKVGFREARYGLELPEGFEIFRVYKGADYRATAVDGQWVLINSGNTYPSLHKLSRAVSGNVENAWNNWYFQSRFGSRRLVSELRDPKFGHGYIVGVFG
jgi:hypothetical protein